MSGDRGEGAAPPDGDAAGSDLAPTGEPEHLALQLGTEQERLALRLGTDHERLALRLGFARGVAPSKWARRWAETGAAPLELVPLPVSGARPPGLDVVLERVAPGEAPAGARGDRPTRRAVRLYTESLALVLPADHELATGAAADRDALELVALLDHPGHAEAWPAPEPWKDPSWMPADTSAALALVASGLGGILLPLPLARHLARKREHAVLPLRLDPAPEGTAIWVSWAVERDGADVQQLVGIMRGRTARSGRPGVEPGQSGGSAREQRSEAGSRAAKARAAKAQTAKKPAAKKSLPKNSRGAQLAAARAKGRGRR